MGVLQVDPASPFLTTPGPGGYKVEWSPGTRLLPLSSAPSDHLVVQCDHYFNAKSPTESDALTFVTDHTTGAD